MNLRRLGVQVSVSHRPLRLWTPCPQFVYLWLSHWIYPDTPNSSGSRFCCLCFSTKTVCFSLRFIFILCALWVFCFIYVPALCAFSVAREARRGRQILWNESYGQMQAVHGYWEWSLSSLREQQGLLSSEPSLQALSTEPFYFNCIFSVLQFLYFTTSISLLR